MKLLNQQFLVIILGYVVDSVAARTETSQASSSAGTDYSTQVWSTTKTEIRYSDFVLVTREVLITTLTVTTIQPVVTSYPATVVETIITKITLEDRSYFSQKRSTTTFTCGIFTMDPSTVVLLSAPSAKGDVAASTF
ncbi:uncharacterized protein LY89DRAFT_673963 [Mollisia scopiformis]|uniref:Uncharacterized protein n=1 Tax=Mollisia scopiformis TaxID=149040 RepID=A0A194WX69_MOLSC|nr:uncharacterized protein LY89DRAFT_673963 [Mollisia scopiformis]KUJ12182.1 hypothetical protein LY89DRAFT_673963 [Mollisia scopiformis]